MDKKKGRTASSSTSKKAAVAALLWFRSRLDGWGEMGTGFRSSKMPSLSEDKWVFVKVP